MKIGQKVREEIMDEFENALGKIKRLEPVKYHVLRAAAESAADAAIAWLEFKP